MVLKHKDIIIISSILLGFGFFFIVTLDPIMLRPEMERVYYPTVAGPLSPPPVSKEAPTCVFKNLYSGPKDPNISADLRKIHDDCASYRKRFHLLLGKQSWQFPSLRLALWDYSQLLGRMQVIEGYVRWLHFTDLTNEDASKLYTHVISTLAVERANISFIRHNVVTLPEERLAYGYQFYPPLRMYQKWMTKIRNQKEHISDAGVEQSLLIKNVTSRLAWQRLYENTRLYMKQHAAESEGSVKLCTYILNQIWKDFDVDAVCHKFETATEASHCHCAFDPKGVDLLTKALPKLCAKTSHRYYALKAKLLGKTRITNKEARAPFHPKWAPTVPWQDAQNAVLDSISAFGDPLYQEYASFFEGEYIEARNIPHKVDGAFIQTLSQDRHPYVFLRYKGQLANLFTLVNLVTQGVAQTMSYAHNIHLIALADPVFQEAYGVLGEYLLWFHLQQHTRSPQEDILLLCTIIERYLSHAIHASVLHVWMSELWNKARKTTLSSEDLNASWKASMDTYFGPAVLVGAAHQWIEQWHLFYKPFSYLIQPFSEHLAQNLFFNFQKSLISSPCTIPVFTQKYMELLQKGNSTSEEDIQTIWNMNLSPDNWLSITELCTKWLDKLEELINRHPELCEK